MNERWGAAAVMAAGMALACGGRAQDEGIIDAVPATAECVRSGVDGATCYPTSDLGREARGATLLDPYGDRIPNLKFVGFRAETPELPIDTSRGTTVVQMADYFDPKAEKYALILLNACTRWCDACNRVADEIESVAAYSLAVQGAVFLQAITEGLAYRPSTFEDLAGFAGDHTANYTLLADPGERLLGSFDIQKAVPFFIAIDPRTMEIVKMWSGAPQTLEGGKFVDGLIAEIRNLPPKP